MKIKNLILLGILVFSSVFFVFEKPVRAEWANYIVISEVQIAGQTADDEFIELYNPTENNIDIGDWSIQYKSATGTTFYKKNFVKGAIVPAHGFFLIVNVAANQELKDLADMTYSAFSLSGGIQIGGGGNIFLVNNQTLLTSTTSTTVVDKVAYGFGDSPETMAALLPSASNSIERKPGGGQGNGQDTDNNNADFFIQTTPNPQNTQSSPEPPIVGPVCDNGICEAGEEQSCPEDCPLTYTLIVSKTGTGLGKVESSPAGIDCGSDCQENYPYNTSVILTATAEQGSTFAGWSGDCSGTGECSLVINSDKSVTATFSLISLPEKCGNGIKEEDEQCDRTDLAGQTCISHGFVGGTLSCDTNCTFNTSNCTAAPPPGGGGGSSTPTFNPSDLVINEFVSDPADGEEEWVELYNSTNEEIDLTGWKIEEGSGAQTSLLEKISPKGFFVVEKIKGYLNNPGDIIILRDKNNQIIDQVVYGNWDDGNKDDNAPVTSDPNSVARIIDGYDTDRDNLDFKISTVPTKGEPNKLAEEKTYPFGVMLNELLPNPKGDDSENEFVELKNLTDQEIDLDGWKLEDAAGTKFIISLKNLSQTKIPAKGFFVLYRKDSKIALNNSGQETLKLYQPNDNLVDFVEYSGTVKDDYAYARDEKNNWFWTTEPTPSKENIILKVNEPPKAVISAKNKALVNEEIIFDASDSYDPDGDSLTYNWDFNDGTKSTEILTKHIYKKAGKYNVTLEVKDSFGASDKVELKIEILAGEKILSYSTLEAEILITEFLPNPKGSDDNEWIEIFNAGKEEIDLEGWFLDDIDGGSKLYKIKEGTKILPGEYLVFERKETKIALNNNFDSVRILDPGGNLFFEISYEKPKEGFSYALDENNDWSWTSILTPGKKNIFSGEGESSFAKASADKGKIIEVNLSEIRNQEIGDLVKIQGVVSVEPGILGVQIFYLAGSGIQIYSYQKDFPNLKVGDRIEVIGELAEFKGETRIKISSKNDIKILKNEVPPQAKEVKTGEIDEDLEGSLVLVQGQMIESRTNYFYLDDGSGEVKVYLKATANIKKPKMKDGDWVKVIGIVSQYGEEYRLLPRYQNDIELIKKPTESDKLQAAGALSETKPLFSKINLEKINPFSKANQSEKIKYLSLSALTLLIILIGLIIRKRKSLK